jgi:protein TonB
MLSTWKERSVLLAIILVHALIFLLSMINIDDNQTPPTTVMQAELISPPVPKNPPPTKPATPPAPKQAPKLLSVAPAEKKASTKQEEKTQEIPKEKSLVQTPSKTEQTVNPESAKTPEPVSNSNNSKSTTPTGTDAGNVELNQLVMVYRPNTEVFYPRLSKDIGEQGIVNVKMMIDETGSVKGVQVITSSGYERLDRAASDLASRIRFAPYKINGVPSRVSAGISIKFQLSH